MKAKYSGPASGTDASYSWVGNDDVGEGKMLITASHPSDHIAIDLEFVKPFAAKRTWLNLCSSPKATKPMSAGR